MVVAYSRWEGIARRFPQWWFIYARYGNDADWFRYQGFERPIYGLMHPTVWKMSPPMAQLAVKVGAVQAHPKMANRRVTS
jgi:hypothetical protein